MTENQLFMKIDELACKLPADVIKRYKRIKASGALNYEDYQDDYLLPKMLITAILRDLEFQYKPLAATNQQNKAIKNFELRC